MSYALNCDSHHAAMLYALHTKLVCYNDHMITKGVPTERRLIRTIAGASRPLREDLDLSNLQAIDRLQKLNTQFEKHWLAPPFLVLTDGYRLPAPMPVGRMLEEIEAHGRPVGIVGAARITSRRDGVFQMMFRADATSKKMVETSAQKVRELLARANEEADKLSREIVQKRLGGAK